MSALWDRFFGRPNPGSKEDAKSRLKVLLVHDQVELTPPQMEKMKAEIMAVIAKYADVDGDRIELKLERVESGGVSLVSSIPVRRVTSRAAG